MTDVLTIAPVQKSLRVKAPIARAFEVFTAGLTRWWPANYGIGPKPIVRVLMEARLGGRWLEVSEDGTETVVATITHWEPPSRVVLLWQVNALWKPDPNMRSEVDVRFFEDGDGGTRLELLHHRFETMGAEAGASMRRDVDGGWPRHLEQYIAVAEGRA